MCVYCVGVLTLSIITHQCVLSLFDEEGLSVLAQLHVQTHWLSVNLYVHLHRTQPTFNTIMNRQRRWNLFNVLYSVDL